MTHLTRPNTSSRPKQLQPSLAAAMALQKGTSIPSVVTAVAHQTTVVTVDVTEDAVVVSGPVAVLEVRVAEVLVDVVMETVELVDVEVGSGVGEKKAV